MDLWIRSQDKTDLVKVNALWIMDNQIWMEVPFYENHKKVGLSVTGNNHKLAQYKTKERALEVLDEINAIKFYKYMASLSIELFLKVVSKNHSEQEKKEIFDKMNTYQMPEE